MGLIERMQRGTGKTVLITGASSGIGEALAREFARDGFDLILVARSADALQKLAAELSATFHIRAEFVVHDLGAAGAGATLLAALGARAQNIYILINNAGFGLIGPFDAQDPQRQLNMVDLNVRVLTELCHAVIPAMRARKAGGIMNVASVGAFQPGPFMAVYFATKAYVRSLSEALNEELRGTGVHVMALCPGPVLTGFQAAADVPTGTKLFTAIPMLTSEDVARRGHRAFFQLRRTYIPDWPSWILAQLATIGPRWLVLRIVRYLHT